MPGFAAYLPMSSVQFPAVQCARLVSHSCVCNASATALLLLGLAWPASAQFADDELPLGRPGLSESRAIKPLGEGVIYTRIERAGVGAAVQPVLNQIPADNGAAPGVGPWVLHVLEIAPDAPYELDLVAGQDTTAGREFTSAMTLRKGALVGVNGGYFVTNEDDGVTGEPAGVGVYDGLLTSEAVQGRANLLLNGARPADVTIAELWTQLSLDAPASDAHHEVDGINRKHGLIRMCGGVGGDSPGPEPATGLSLPAPAFFLDGEMPYHDWTCVDDSEIIVYNAHFGLAVPTADYEVRVSENDQVLSSGPSTGQPVEAGSWVASASGSAAAAWLQTHAAVGATLRFTTRMVDAEGHDVSLSEHLEITNGGPRLLRHGEVAIDAHAEGFSAIHPLPGFGLYYSHTAQPRLLAGKRADNTLLLVLADGRRADYSLGLSLPEAARVMQALGAVDAINLDGGGSATMVGADGALINRVSGSAERNVADALLVVPKTTATSASGNDTATAPQNAGGAVTLFNIVLLCAWLPGLRRRGHYPSPGRRSIQPAGRRCAA